MKHVWIILSLVFLAVAEVTELRQEDFLHGTYLIERPGTYKLMEDITFNPNSVEMLDVDPYYAGDVLMSQYSFAGGAYDPAAYGIGFFAAIAIYGTDVILDLNGHLLEQSVEFTLQQRFFSLIELADQPFEPTQGPHDFDGGTGLRPAMNVIVKNGRLGRTSHHAIHGNHNTNVTIVEVDIYKVAVAAIALNGVQGLTIKNVNILGSDFENPVIGLYSVSRFLRPYLEWLVNTNANTTLRVQGQELNAVGVRAALKEILEDVFEDIVHKRRKTIDEDAHPLAYAIYHNSLGIIDGNAYGILLNRPGVAVNGFPAVPTDPAEYVTIENVRIENLANHVIEVVVVETAVENKPLLDPVGAAVQLFNLHPTTHQPNTMSKADVTGRYTGNPVANAQILIGKAVLEGKFVGSSLPTSLSGTNWDFVEWVESGSDLSTYLSKYDLFCNGDTMFHVNKGFIAMKLDAASSVTVREISMKNITNYGKKGSTICHYNSQSISHPLQTTPGYNGADARGFSFSGSVNVFISDCIVENVGSKQGSAYGFDVLRDSHDITISNCEVNTIKASLGEDIDEYGGSSPNKIPEAYGFFAGENSSYIDFDLFLCSDVRSVGISSEFTLLGKNSHANPAEEPSSSASYVPFCYLLILFVLF